MPTRPPQHAAALLPTQALEPVQHEQRGFRWWDSGFRPAHELCCPAVRGTVGGTDPVDDCVEVLRKHRDEAGRQRRFPRTVWSYDRRLPMPQGAETPGDLSQGFRWL